MKKVKHLYRSKSNQVLAGVCGGIGEYLDVDPVIIRLVWILFTIASVGVGLLLYIAAWILVPQR